MSKYRYHILHRPGFVNYTGSNLNDDFYWHLEPDRLIDEHTVVTWELNDLPLTQKFVEAYKTKMYAIIYNKFVRKQKRAWRIIYDVYKGLTAKDVLASRVEMNNIIEFINSELKDKVWFSIPTELKLNESNLLDKRLHNLNELHDIFETRMVELSSKFSRKEIDEATHELLWNKLQSINLLVHYNERLRLSRNQTASSLEDLPASYFTSLKCETPRNTEILLEPEDYKHFTCVRSSTALTLDFGTVGKDLFNCSVTDDQELVYKGMISQQWELNPWVQFDWCSCTEEEWGDQMVLYDKWIKDNNIADYLDLSDPKYTPGRHQLGECISHNFTCAADYIDQVISHSPKITGFVITDEQNNSIL
jgi:hypothetical protein